MPTSLHAIGNPGLVQVKDDGNAVHCTPLVRSPMHSGADRYKEVHVQKLIAQCPSLLPVRDFLPATSSLFSLGCEVPVDVGGTTGYIDNLLVTNEGWLVLVEAKLQRNSESTREVIAQVLQYGMALSALGLRELEASLRLLAQKTIRDYVSALPEADGELIEDFEDKLEQHLRRGELLYLIVSDGIHHSVERITHWLDKGGSTAFKFGLVEFRFFDTDNETMLVVPRTLLKTREVSRHVVVVDIKGPAASNATATVHDHSKTLAGSQPPTQRRITPAGPPMTRERLIAEVRASKGDAEAATASRALGCLEALGLAIRCTPTTLQFGLNAPPEDGVFHSLISFTTGGVWSHPTSDLIDVIGDEEFVQHKLRMNTVAPFYRPEQAIDPTKRRHELVPSFDKLVGKEEQLAQAIAATRDVALERLLA